MTASPPMSVQHLASAAIQIILIDWNIPPRTKSQTVTLVSSASSSAVLFLQSATSSMAGSFQL